MGELHALAEPDRPVDRQQRLPRHGCGARPVPPRQHGRFMTRGRSEGDWDKTLDILTNAQKPTQLQPRDRVLPEGGDEAGCRQWLQQHDQYDPRGLPATAASRARLSHQPPMRAPAARPQPTSRKLTRSSGARSNARRPPPAADGPADGRSRRAYRGTRSTPASTIASKPRARLGQRGGDPAEPRLQQPGRVDRGHAGRSRAASWSDQADKLAGRVRQRPDAFIVGGAARVQARSSAGPRPRRRACSGRRRNDWRRPGDDRRRRRRGAGRRRGWWSGGRRAVRRSLCRRNRRVRSRGRGRRRCDRRAISAAPPARWRCPSSSRASATVTARLWPRGR
jgi:hypothetical protein